MSDRSDPDLIVTGALWRSRDKRGGPNVRVLGLTLGDDNKSYVLVEGTNNKQRRQIRQDVFLNTYEYWRMGAPR